MSLFWGFLTFGAILLTISEMLTAPAGRVFPLLPADNERITGRCAHASSVEQSALNTDKSSKFDSALPRLFGEGEVASQMMSC